MCIRVAVLCEPTRPRGVLDPSSWIGMLPSACSMNKDIMPVCLWGGDNYPRLLYYSSEQTIDPITLSTAVVVKH